jgi:hypothetical protein
MSEPEETHVRLEEDAIPTRRIVVLLLATVAATVVSIALARVLHGTHERALGAVTAPVALAPPDQVFHGLIAVERTGQRDAANAREALTTYGWVDRDRRVIRIPVDRAIELELAALTSGSAPGRSR